MSKDSRSPKKRTPRKGADVDSDSDDEINAYDDEGGQMIGDIYVPPPPPPPKYSGDSTGIRLIITYIENNDFKSYAGRQLLGPFHKSFTSIVGPNGSGKSNVIDSMLFVFGYRAQKLRSKKLSVLIHNSDTFPNCQRAEVTVHFALINDKGGNDFELIAGSEFKVSRTIHKDNSSYYAIDGRRVQFKEVSQLLQSHGVDLRYNRFLILQGEVEQIALMKPKAESENDNGMLEFLEDIIGCSRLKVPLFKLQERVEEKNVLRAEKLNRVKVVEKEKDSLLEARNEAVLFLETENQLAKKKNEFYQLQRAEAMEVRNEALSEYEKANEVYKEAMSKIEEVRKTKSDKETEVKLCHDKLVEISKKAEDYNESFKEAEKRDTEVRSKVKHTKAKGKKMEEDLNNEKKKLEDLMKVPEKCANEQEELSKRKEQLEEDKQKAEEHLSHVMGLIKEDTQQFQQKKDEYETQLLSLQKGVNESRSKHEVADSELELYLNKERMEKAKLDQFKLKFERNNEEVKEKQSSFKDLKKNIPVTENRLQEINNEVSRIVEQKTRISSELRANNEKLQEAKNVVNSHTSRNAVVNALMEQKRSGNIEGIFGRLGDLGAIDQKYDVAISTACGSLDNIVTDTMECAQQCVRFLKANNIGSATFIALDKQTRLESQCRSRIETPENVPRLFDLVKINDERVRPAFYFALRDTLVCENLTQATRIGLGGRKRWRVVTLRGELVETSGAMSGGGRPSSGKMGSSISGAGVNEEEIREMEGAVNTLKSKFNDIKTREEHLNAENEKLKRDLEQMKQRLPKLELELSEFDKKQSELKKSINEQEVRTKEAAPDAKKVKELEKKVGALKSDYDKKAEEAKAIEVKIKDLNGKIAEIMDKKVGTAKKQVESLNQDIEKVTSAFTKSTVSQKTALRNIEKSKSKIETMKKELEDSEALIVKLKEEMKEIEIKATDITAKYEECCNERDEVYKKHKELQSELNVLKEKESRLNSDNLDTKHEVDKLEKVLKDKEAEVNKWHSHIKSLQLQEIDGQPPPEDGLPELTKEQLQCLNSHSVQKEIENMDKELKKMKPNMAAIAEYRKKQAVYLDRVKELEAVTEERDMYKSQFENLRAQRLKEFKDGFTLITRKLKEMYRTITLGGDAELEWIDSLDPFSEGINFTVRPNKKSWKRITNLSGGEKTLSSLALIFALHYYKPSPLYVMDEIDAALDFRNVSIVAHYIKQRTQNTQFIIISLRNNMYELANRLVGIYKTSNCTKSVTYNPCNKEARKKVVGSSVSNGTDIESVVEKQNIPITTTVEMVQ